MRVAATGLILLLVCTQCKKNIDPTTVDYWAEQAERRQNRADALKELGKLHKPEAVPVLLKWLDEEGPWQTDAAYSLGQLGNANTVGPLIAHIDYGAGTGPGGKTSDKLYTNLAIIHALALMHATSAAEPLLKLLTTHEDKTREAVVSALGSLQASNAVGPLTDLLSKPDTPVVIGQASLRALGNIGDPKAVGSLIVALYNDSLYEDARIAILQIGSAAQPPLVATLNRANSAVEALRTADGKQLPEGAIETRAATVLGAMRATEATPAVATAFDKLVKRYSAKPKEAPPSVFSGIIELAYALGNLGGPLAVKELLPLTKAPNDTLRVAAAEALTTAGPDPASVQALLSAAGTGSPDARDSLIEAVTRLGNNDVLPAVDAMPKKADKETPASVLSEIVEEARDRLVAAGECKQEAGCWRSKLKAPNPVVRERAAYEMGWLNVADSVADLMKVAEDDVPEVRMAAILSLQRVGGADPAKLQKIYDAWASKMQYAAVNQELRALIARSKKNKS